MEYTANIIRFGVFMATIADLKLYEGGGNQFIKLDPFN